MNNFVVWFESLHPQPQFMLIAFLAWIPLAIYVGYTFFTDATITGDDLFFSLLQTLVMAMLWFLFYPMLMLYGVRVACHWLAKRRSLAIGEK